jgi:hypothetical protein
VVVVNCKSFEDLSAFSHAQEVKLSYCFKVASILPLQPVRKVTIHACTGIKDWERLSNPHEDFMRAKRKVILSGGLYIRTELMNVYHLVIEACSLYRGLASVENGHHLEIRNVGLYDTKGLGKITGSLILSGCSSLRSVEDLENIPKVTISSCPNIFSFSGLGHHKTLLVCGSSRFEEMWKEFQQEYKHHELFESVEHLYIG